MAKPSTTLTDTKVKNAKAQDKDYKLFDSGGLFLLVTKSGGKHWKLKYYFEGKEKKLSLGEYPFLSLSEARKKVFEAKTLLKNETDPNAQKKQEQEIKKQVETKSENTFKKVALERLEQEQGKISESHYKRTLRGLENDCFKYIGDKPLDDISRDDILDILERVAKRKVNNSGRKLYQSIGQVFKWAVTKRYAKQNPASNINLNDIFGKQDVKGYATLTADADIRGLLASIDGYRGEYTTKQALKFMSYTAVRTINVRHAEWCEIDFKTKQWNIPASKMKTSTDLIVPLTPNAIKILQEMQDFTGSGKYIFPSIRSGNRAMSDNTMLGAIRRLGFTKEEFTPHGFRAMFSSIAHEKSPFKYEAIEIQLAHSVGNSVAKAYNRALYLDERVELMQWWSDYLDDLFL